MQRIISNPDHNIFQASGVEKHKPTLPAPTKMLMAVEKKMELELENKFRGIIEEVSSMIGKPYYAKNNFILYHADMRDILPKLCHCRFKIDLTVTSPPYNIGKEYENIISVNEYVGWCASWMENIYDYTKDTGAFWLNLGYFEVPEKGLCVPIPYLLWDKSRFYLLQEIVWNYGAGVSAKTRLSPRNEKWLFYVKDAKKYTFNLDEIRDPNVKYPNQKKNGKFRCNPLGKNPSDVWTFPKVTTGANRSSKERTNHPAQFPLSVLERILLASSNKLDVVVDPFAGSCSTGIASVGLSRIFVGIELNQSYCDLAIQRFENFMTQRQAFQDQNKILSIMSQDISE